MPFLFETFFFLTFVVVFLRIGYEMLTEKRVVAVQKVVEGYGDVQSLMRSGQYTEALQLLEARATTEQNPEWPYTLMAECHQALDEYQLALRCCYRALSANLYYTPAYVAKLKALYMLGDYPLALETCDYLARLNPSLPEIYYYRAFIAEKNGQQPDTAYLLALQRQQLQR